MQRTVALLGAVAGLVLASPAGAHARAIVGMGDQKPAMLTDERFLWLGIRHVRLVVSWDVQRTTVEREWVNGWLRDAAAAGVEPLVAFGHAWSGPERRRLPTVKAYRSAFLRFRAAHPWVRTFTAWNEANHCSQPTCHHPERAAAYYDVIRSACPSCTVVAADVLDQPNMGDWLRRFRRAARHPPRLWGLHNYLDANRLRSAGTDRLLRLVPGQVWITETGGVVRRNRYRGRIAFPESAPHAARVTGYVLALADRRPRIRRIYLYQWNADSLFQAWDSGIIDPFGRRRPAFEVLARRLGRDPSSAPADRDFQGAGPREPPVPAGPGAEEQPPPSQRDEQPPPSGPSQPDPAPGGAPPPCPLVLVCPPALPAG